MKPYRFGGRFSLVSGRKWFTKDGLDFGSSVIKDREYETVFGPVFVSGCLRYKLDDVGLRGAVTRLTCAREPTEKGLHERLVKAQFRNYGESEPYVLFLKEKAGEIRKRLPSITNQTWRENWVNAPHPKKKLRMRTHIELALDGTEVKKVWLGNHGVVKYVCKPGEKLPPGKFLRATADLGPIGAAQAGYMMDTVKEAFTVPFMWNRCSYMFIKSPDRDVLVKAFQDVWNCDLDMCLRCFSDDAIIGINTPEGRFVANTDISACDGSNYDPVFDYLEAIMLRGGLDRHDVRGVFDQTEAECVISSYADREFGRRIRKVRLKPKYRTLYSGSVLTTSVNNCANFGIYAEVASMLPPFAQRKKADMPRLVSEAAARIGYILKCQVCEVVEDMQFLKTSPCIVGGVWDVFLNLGVLLRGLGMCRGDLPGRGDLSTRASAYMSDIIKSYVHAGDHVILDALRTALLTEVSVSEHEFKLTGNQRVRVPTDALARRYKVPARDFEYLAMVITSTGLGEAIHSPIIDAIFGLDYGYPSLASISQTENLRIIHGVPLSRGKLVDRDP